MIRDGVFRKSGSSQTGGCVEVAALPGGGVAVRDTKPIDLVVNLVAEGTAPLDRLGISENTIEILGLRRPRLTVPVAPGKSLSLLIEAATRKYLLGQRGMPDAATEFLTRHDEKLQGR